MWNGVCSAELETTSQLVLIRHRRKSRGLPLLQHQPIRNVTASSGCSSRVRARLSVRTRIVLLGTRCLRRRRKQHL
ncbi:unnamed protein product [Amoebophrya sp. A25]|nr:unnamed protein product [Amoebophrya sp. A25]|eukprot:GSA25T00024027001.1